MSRRARGVLTFDYNVGLRFSPLYKKLLTFYLSLKQRADDLSLHKDIGYLLVRAGFDVLLNQIITSDTWCIIYSEHTHSNVVGCMTKTIKKLPALQNEPDLELWEPDQSAPNEGVKVVHMGKNLFVPNRLFRNSILVKELEEEKDREIATNRRYAFYAVGGIVAWVIFVFCVTTLIESYHSEILNLLKKLVPLVIIILFLILIYNTLRWCYYFTCSVLNFVSRPFIALLELCTKK